MQKEMNNTRINKSKQILIKIISISALLIFLAFIIYVMFILTIFSAPSNEKDNNDTAKKISMIKCTEEWGRLAELPDSKTEFNIYTEGNSFTRSFRCSFYLPKSDLDKWIKESSGLQDAEIKTIDSSKKRYIIKPGKGANHAESTIDFQKCYVEIYVSWS